MISKFIRKARRLLDYYQEYGFLECYRHIYADSIGYDKFAIFERDLSEPVEKVYAGIPIKIRLLHRSEKDINRLVEFWPDYYTNRLNTPQKTREIITSRLSAGEKCMIAEYEGKIIHMNWIGFQNTHLFNPFVLKKGIGAGEALSYQIYCAEKYRGNNIMSAVASQMFNLLKRGCYKKIVSYVAPHNYASIKVFTKMSGKPVQTLYYLGILGFRVSFLSRKEG